MMTDIKRTTLRTTIITTIIKEVADKGGDKNVIIDKLSTLPRSTLIKALEEKDNPYYCQLALNEQDRKGDGVLLDIPKNIMNDLRKKSHFGYQQKVSKTKRDHDRKIKSKDLLRSDSKD